MFNSHMLPYEESELTNQINKYYEKICSNNYSDDAIGFFKQQVAILRKRLDKIQETIEDEDELDIYYSLRSWFEDYYNTTYDHAYSLANEHCKTISSLYHDKYGYKPAKICKEWLFKDGEQYKEITVNSYNKEEFDSVLKPYFDECLEIESST